ncbi:histone methyltransferase set2 [Xylographa opegraphella]|nr:histone methyltransferase set2 [Xylographa opegraphella]
MSDDEQYKEPDKVEEGIKDMRIKSNDYDGNEEGSGTIRNIEQPSTQTSGTGASNKIEIKTATHSPGKRNTALNSPVKGRGEHEQTVGGDISLKLESGPPPKLSRTASQKVIATAPQMFDHYEDKTQEAAGVFQIITQCSYSAKYLGSTEHAMECDCIEEWADFRVFFPDPTAKSNHACGEDSDCINRATKMECFGDCGCGSDCQNQRFQRQQFARVTVIKTEKKGYGLRADTDLQPNDFIFEYIGEVIHEGQFRRRMLQYDEEGIKHFYFMSLSKGEFVDATKKGNLGRFCNHSCNPNCYVDKWVVGDKLRMGIFADRKIKAGEELVFNYNVDRYGADPQPCYCGEPNCTGFIGGKTQTERATKLSHTTIEALGIDDGDGWDTAVAKKPRKKKAGEDDEEYVNTVQPKSLDEDGVTKVMATLMQCKEKWITVKLLGRIQCCKDEKVINRVVKMHGYQILNSSLTTWNDDFNVVLQILDILHHFPRLTRNKINDSKIETTVASLEFCGDERVVKQATALLKEWSTLETAYRIPRMKRDSRSIVERHNHFERREAAREKLRSESRSKSRSRSRSHDASKGPAAPTGPRSSVPQRNGAFFGGRAPFRPPRPFNGLPSGWFTATSNGSVYYYSANGETTWTRPTKAAAQPPPPPKPVSTNKALDDIINEITNAKAKTPDKNSASATPQLNGADPSKHKNDVSEKWRAYSEEKQKKLYENTLFPHIKYVVDRYRKRLSKDELKRFAKEISKKLVNSDFKNHRVDDPTHINSRQVKQVKKYVQDFFEKVVTKKEEHVKKKAERESKEVGSTKSPVNVKAEAEIGKEEESDIDGLMEMSEDEDTKAGPNSLTPITPLDQITVGEGLKRKREDQFGLGDFVNADDNATPNKRARSVTPPAPPPPPPLDMGTPEGNSEVHDSGNFDDALYQETSSYVPGKLEHISYADAPTDHSAYPIDNYQTLCTEYELSTQGTVELPPPPPPPATSGLSSGVSHIDLGSEMYAIGCSYDQSLALTAPRLDINDSQNQGLCSMQMQRSKYLEAQESS